MTDQHIWFEAEDVETFSTPFHLLTLLKQKSKEICDNDDVVTIRIGQGDAVLASPVHLSDVAQRNLSSRILVNQQIN